MRKEGREEWREIIGIAVQLMYFATILELDVENI